MVGKLYKKFQQLSLSKLPCSNILKSEICIISFTQLAPKLVPCFWSIFTNFQNEASGQILILQANINQTNKRFIDQNLSWLANEKTIIIPKIEGFLKTTRLLEIDEVGYNINPDPLRDTRSWYDGILLILNLTPKKPWIAIQTREIIRDESSKISKLSIKSCTICWCEKFF